MIITKSSPFTPQEIQQLLEEYDPYVKTVIDLKQKICSAGMNRHFEGEQILLKEYQSRQSEIWGGGLDTETKEIDCNSFINIRPRDDNPQNEILNPNIRSQYKELTKFFFKEIL